MTAPSPWTPDVLRGMQRRLGLNEVDFYPSIDSTNSLALDRVREEALLTPTVVLAQEQLAGRGRSQNQWWSTSGSLTFSLVLEAPEASGIPVLPLVMGVAVGRAMRDLLGAGPDIELKWPNDVYGRDRKLAGLLVESVGGKKSVVIGCGLNVNQRMDEAPEEIRLRSISMYEMVGQTLHLPEVLESLLHRMLGAHREFLENKMTWLDEFRASCWLSGHVIQVDQGAQAWVGRCLGIDEQGQLILETEQGTRSVHTGTVRRLDEKEIVEDFQRGP